MRKATEILIEKTNNFLNAIDDFESVVLNDEFECIPTTKEIKIDAKCMYGNNYDEFLKTLYDRTSREDISLFTWALLHEVGHCMTEQFMDIRANNHCMYMKKKIENGKLATIHYYSLADEKRATNWAIRFVNVNYDFVKEFDNSIRGLI